MLDSNFLFSVSDIPYAQFVWWCNPPFSYIQPQPMATYVSFGFVASY